MPAAFDTDKQQLQQLYSGLKKETNNYKMKQKKHSKYTPQTCNSTLGKISCAVKSNIHPLWPIFDLQYCDEEQMIRKHERERNN